MTLAGQKRHEAILAWRRANGLLLPDEPQPIGMLEVPMPPKSPLRFDCEHRREFLRLTSCGTCQGAVKIKIYACELHGECVFGKGPPGIHICEIR